MLLSLLLLLLLLLLLFLVLFLYLFVIIIIIIAVWTSQAQAVNQAGSLHNPPVGVAPSVGAATAAAAVGAPTLQPSLDQILEYFRQIRTAIRLVGSRFAALAAFEQTLAFASPPVNPFFFV